MKIIDSIHNSAPDTFFHVSSARIARLESADCSHTVYVLEYTIDQHISYVLAYVQHTALSHCKIGCASCASTAKPQAHTQLFRAV